MAKREQFIFEFLDGTAYSDPSREVLVHDSVRMTYGDLKSRTDALAATLISKGIVKGDRVAILFNNGPEYVIAYYGTLKSGAVAVPINTGSGPDKLKLLLENIDPRAVLIDGNFAELLQKSEYAPAGECHLIAAGLRTGWEPLEDLFCVYDFDSQIDPSGAQYTDPGLVPGDLASIIYTSGSTGVPKGVMLTHSNIVANTRSICSYLGLTGGDVQMVVLPFFYVMGKSLLNTHIAAGGRVVVNNKFLFPATVIKQMADEGVTGFSGVPSTFAHLLHRSPLREFRDRLPKLRYVSQAGGNMPLAVKEELRKVLPDHTKIFIMYGATEASARLTYLDPAYFENKKSSIGREIPGVTIRILDSKRKEVLAGQIGELVAQGENIMKGYWKDPQGSAKVLSEYGYHTGDMGYRDQDGFLFVTGRNDDLLKVGGHRINPREIEETLMATRLLAETTVIGIPDKKLGNKLVSLSVPVEGELAEETLLRECLDRLPRYMLPERIIFTKSLPKSANGKVDRARCRAVIEGA